jgi:hypothetical protein
MKLCANELNLRIEMFAMELLGPCSQIEFMAPRAIDDGRCSYRMLSARGGTIAAGKITSSTISSANACWGYRRADQPIRIIHPD